MCCNEVLSSLALHVLLCVMSAGGQGALRHQPPQHCQGAGGQPQPTQHLSGARAHGLQPGPGGWTTGQYGIWFVSQMGYEYMTV